MFLRWGVAAVIAGPALGVGAAWLRGPNALRAAAAVTPIAGILQGEGRYGLTVLAVTASGVITPTFGRASQVRCRARPMPEPSKGTRP